MAFKQKTKKFRIWYGKYGQRDKIVEAKDSNEILVKYSKLDIQQITRIK